MSIYMLNAFLLTTTPNDCRKNGNIPAILYGNNLNQKIFIKADSFIPIKDRRIPLVLKLEGKEYSVQIKEVQIHSLTDKILHVDFFAIGDKKFIPIKVKIVPKGIPKGVLIGGILLQITKELLTFQPADSSSFVETIEVDVSGLEKKKKIFSDSIKEIKTLANKVLFTIVSR